MKPGKNFKSWRKKLEKPMDPKIIEIPETWASRIGHGKMLVPTPLLVDKVIRKIKKGRLVTVNNLREKLADDFGADTACPLTTGIFLNIAANTAEEDKASGKKIFSPYWRVIKNDGSLNPKFPGGIQQQEEYLKREKFTIFKGKGKDVLKVKDFTNALMKLE